MGASSWHYFTPYRSDPEQALQELRRDVFARGDYSMGFGGFAPPGKKTGNAPDPLTALAQNPAAFLAGHVRPGDPKLETMARIVRAAQSGDYTGLSEGERTAARPLLALFRPSTSSAGSDEVEDDNEVEEKPETIDELLEMAAEDGTHSILDISRTAPQLDFGVAAPLPAARIVEAFETEHPTHEQVEQGWDDVAEELDRWQAYYVTIYRDCVAAEYAFIGCSGD